jgi:arylsulfatase B
MKFFTACWVVFILGVVSPFNFARERPKAEIPAAVEQISAGVAFDLNLTGTSSVPLPTTKIPPAGTVTRDTAPSITTSVTLPHATPSAAYSTTLAAAGGAGSYVWSTVSGALPSGLTLSTGGVISGTTAAQGNFNVTLKVTDSAGQIATQASKLTVTALTAPNVVIILTDDQGWGDIGYHTPPGEVPIQTPNMDGFLTHGIRLEMFYATPVCSVTRSCLLTGRNPIRTATGNVRGLDLSEHIMPQTFKAAGYQTYMCGKWHIGGWANNIHTTTLNGTTSTVIQESDAYLPHNRGWDTHYGLYGGAINYFTHRTNDPGLSGHLDWWLNGITQNETTDLQGNGGYSTDLLADKAVSLIQSRDPLKPMLLYLAFNAAHAGVSAPPAYLTKYQNLGVTNAARRTLSAAVDCMDVAVGRVLNALDTAGIANNTLVVFMSDNGGNETTGSINDPLRGTKNQDSYDGGNIHTPAAIRWPGTLSTGIISNQYIWVGDLFPTLCAATGVTAQNSKPFDGLNLWPSLLSINSSNPDGSQRPSALVTSVTKPTALNTFIDPVLGGSKMFKVIRTKGPPVTNELFNMTDDPYETTNLLVGVNAASYSTILTSLTTSITNITAENYPPHIGEAPRTQTVTLGSTVTLYVPFTSYKEPTVQWQKNGGTINGATAFMNVTNALGATVNGVYLATHTLTNVLPGDAASYSVVVTNVAGPSTSQAGTVTVISPQQQAWWLAHLGTINDTGNAAPLADPENDTIPNLAEWAFGLDPMVSDPARISVSGAILTRRGMPDLKIFTTELGTDYRAIFGRRKDYLAAGLTYIVQFSADLTTWENGTITPTVVASDAEMDAVTVPYPLLLSTGAKARFFRVRMVVP